MPDPALARRMPRWLGALPVSLVLHAVILLAIVSLVRREEALPALMIDLNAIVADAGDESGGRATGAASSGTRAVRPETGAPRTMSQPARRRAASALRPSEPRGAPLEPSPSAAPASSASTSAAASASPAPPAPPSPPPPSTERGVRAAPPMSTAATPSAAREPAPGPVTSSPDTGASPMASGGAVPQGPGSGSPSPSAGNAADGGRGRQITGSGSGGVGASGGDRLALAIPGGGDGGPSTEYSAYLSRLRAQLQQALRYPASAQRRGITGTVQLEIAIEADGAVSSVELAASSSYDALDRAALEAARSLPRQPFPADVRARPLRVRVPVTFRLQ